MSNNKEQNTQKEYFNLHTTGVGYINRMRIVTPKKGDKFLAADIAAIRGNADDVDYTYFSTRFNGKAKTVIEDNLNAIKASNASDDGRVLISFIIADIYPQAFIYNKGKKQGEAGCNIYGRVIGIKSLKIDANVVYTTPKRNKVEQVETTPIVETPTTEVAQQDTATESPAEVSLSKDDADFEVRKAELKAKGYTWNNDKNVWVAPSAA